MRPRAIKVKKCPANLAMPLSVLHQVFGTMMMDANVKIHPKLRKNPAAKSSLLSGKADVSKKK